MSRGSYSASRRVERRTERPKRPAGISRLVTLFRGLRMRSANTGRRLRGWVAFVAYDGNGVVAQVHDQFLRLLFG